MRIIQELDVDRIFASLIFGLWASSFLFGVITVQIYLYYQKFPNDPRYSRLLVGLLWLMQCVEVGVTTYDVYTILIPRAGLLGLLAQPWYRSYYGTHEVIVAFMVHTFFIWRYWSVSRNILITAALTVFMSSALGLGLYVTIESYLSLGSAWATLERIYGVLTAWLILATITDVAIAGALAFEMRKRRTGLSKTDSVLTRIALYGAATGAVTASVLIIELLLFDTKNMFEVIIFFGMPLGGLYIATFMAKCVFPLILDAHIICRHAEHIRLHVLPCFDWQIMQLAYAIIVAHAVISN